MRYRSYEQEHGYRGVATGLAADYDASASFSSEDASQECQRTRAFLDRIHRYLLAQGLTDNELGTEAGNA